MKLMRVGFALAMLFLAFPCRGAVVQVQQAFNSDVTGTTFTSFSATFNSATASGNGIIFGVTFGNTNPIITATDSAGNSYTEAIQTYDAAHRQGSAIFYSTNITGGSSHTVTISFNSGVSYLALGIHEYNGVANSSPLDVATGITGSGTSLSSGSVTTTANGDLIFGLAVEDAVGSGDAFTAGSGFTKRVDLGDAAAYADEDEVQSTAGAIASNWTLAPAGLDWIADVAAFKASTGPAGPAIASLSPNSGPSGQLVTINGANFGTSLGTSTVTLNGITAAPASWSSTSVVVTVPNGATSGNVVVTVGGQASNSFNFIVSSIHHAQQASNGDESGATYTSFSATFGSSTAAGNAIIFGVAYGNTNPTITATDSLGNAYIQAIKTYDSGRNEGCAIFYATHITGGSSNTVTVNFGSSVGYLALGIHEYAGLATSSPLDVTSGNTGLGSALTSGSTTTTGNGDLIFSCAVEDSYGGGDTYTPGSGFAKRVDLGTSTGYADEDRIQPNAGALEATWTLSPDFLNWIVDMAAFKPAQAGGAGPGISSLSPNSGAVGTSVTITGTNFGSSQGTSSLTFNGVAGTPTSWSSTAIVVPVPTGATTGNVTVIVGGVASNGVNFTVTSGGTPPSISASVSPTANANGWNNSNVTVTFTCNAGSAAIANCPSPQTISSEGTNQVVSGTATDVNGLTATTSVTLNIDKTQPAIAVLSPADGTSFSNAAVTVSGTVSDAQSGVSSVICDGAGASVTGGSFSCNISLNIGVNLVVVRVTDLAGNVSGSNFHLSLTGTLPSPNSLQITPSGVNMVVGQTKQFTAVDELGRPRSDAAWTIDDTSLANISTDSSPTLTALAVGQVTLTATAQSKTVQVQVNILAGTSLAPGTVLWSAPPVPGFTALGIIQAVPSGGNTPDLYGINEDSNGNNLISAFTSDGQQLWQANLGPAGASPDGFGGILTSSGAGLFPFITVTTTDRDGVTGSPVWSYSTLAQVSRPAIRQDGTIFQIETTPPDANNFNSDSSSLVALDGTVGAPLPRVPLPSSTFKSIDCNGVVLRDLEEGPFLLSNLAIDSDGTLSVAIEVETSVSNYSCSGGLVSAPFTSALSLFQLKPDGSTSLTPIHTNTEDLATATTGRVPRAWPWQVIPDGRGGSLVAWTDYSPEQPFDYITHLAPSGQYDYPFPSLSQTISSMVLGDNGAAYATDSQTIQAFDINSGQPLWTYVSQALDGIAIIASTSGGGLVAKEFLGFRQETPLRFDSTGLPTYDGTGSATPASSFGSSLSASWTADLNGLATTPSSSGALLPVSLAFQPFDVANIIWTQPFADPSGSGGATQPIASQARVQIAATALGYVGSQNWLDDPNPSDPAPNHCNIFVHDVLKQVGLTPPDSDLSSRRRRFAYLVGLVDSPFYPARAGDWANPAKILKGWKTVLIPVGAPTGSYPPDFSLPGDIIAEAIQYSDATGHVGIIVNNLQHQTASADSTTSCDFSGLPAGVITITDYGFRPDNYQRICQTPNGNILLTHGQERYAVVKRFFGQ